MPTDLSPSSVKQTRPLRILVADDNEVFRTAIRGLLQSLGHVVDVVSNGREVVEASTQAEFDIFFLDIQMPEMSGVEAAHCLRREYPGGKQVRIIGVSGQMEEREIYEAAGMDHFLLKPVRLADLVEVLDEVHISASTSI